MQLMAATQRSAAWPSLMVSKKNAPRIALISLFHLANNIRLVKEADALVSAGYEVDVFATRYLSWAGPGDAALLKHARWRAHFVSYDRTQNPALFWYSRFRRKIASRLWLLLRNRIPSWITDSFAFRALDRVLPEMHSLVMRHPADLYIGHGSQSLPIVVDAARRNHAMAGFDAEDFHLGMKMMNQPSSLDDELTEFTDAQCMRKIQYLTAASPGVAAALARIYPSLQPVPILNVFSLAERPATMRPSRPEDSMRLYWVSQTIGRDRGLEDAVRACALLPPGSVELHLRGNWQVGYERELRCLWDVSTRNPAALVIQELLPPDQMVRAATMYDVGLALETPCSENRRICMNDLSTSKVFTYLLAGLAVAASGVEANPSIFEGSGFTYRSGDAEGLANGLRHWVVNRQALCVARENAWRISEQKYNWEIEQRKLLAMVEGALAGRPVAA